MLQQQHCSKLLPQHRVQCMQALDHNQKGHWVIIEEEGGYRDG
jgi:hypothetical protein